MSSVGAAGKGARLDNQELAILVINALNNVVLIFFGPFLAAYFMTSGNVESLPALTIHYISMYFWCAASIPVLGYFLSGRNKHLVLFVGVIMYLLVAIYVAVLKDNIMNHIVFFGFIRGITEQAFCYPFNYFCIDKVSDESRVRFETGRAASSKITNIVVPVVFGGIITATSFMRTSGIILVLSALTIVVSFFIRSTGEASTFRLWRATKSVFSHSRARTMVLAEILTGFYNTVPGSIFPALIFMENTSNMSLGVVTSVASLLFLLVQIVLNRLNLRRTWLNYLWAGLCIAGALVYCIHESFVTVVIAYVLYVIGLGLFSVSTCVKLFSFAKGEELGSTTKVELWGIREISLGLGRVIALVILYVVAVKVPSLLSWLLVLMLATMVPFYMLISRIPTNAQ